MSPRLTVFFIVEPPSYQVMACYLAASLRENFGETVALVGYCPAHKIDLVAPDVKAALAKMGCDLRPMLTEGRFDPAYPHGNKILAAMERRETEFSCFMDSDILTLRPNRVENLIKEGAVSLTPAASMGWGSQEVWPRLYEAAGVDMPEERISLMRRPKRIQHVPYFSSGLFSFPEQYVTPEGQRFPEVWMDVAQAVDRLPDLDAKRPYLDQMTLPIAIRKAGLAWNLLPEEQHYILGGNSRGEPLPEGREIFTIHYRQWPIVHEIGLAGYAKTVLQRFAGVKRVAEPTEKVDAKARALADRKARNAARAEVRVAEKAAAKATGQKLPSRKERRKPDGQEAAE